jgi:hypothetical protein
MGGSQSFAYEHRVTPPTQRINVIGANMSRTEDSHARPPKTWGIALANAPARRLVERSRNNNIYISSERSQKKLELRSPCAEVPTNCRERRAGSKSKLRTYRDRTRIFLLIVRLTKDERPFQFFGLVSVAVGAIAVALAVPIFITYGNTGLVPRLPAAVLSVGIVVLGALSFFTGLTLEMITRTRQELKRLVHLSISNRDAAERPVETAGIDEDLGNEQ